MTLDVIITAVEHGPASRSEPGAVTITLGVVGTTMSDKELWQAWHDQRVFRLYGLEPTVTVGGD
jgi:hypothetical protein